jgi:hypothetical protein
MGKRRLPADRLCDRIGDVRRVTFQLNALRDNASGMGAWGELPLHLL